MSKTGFFISFLLIAFCQGLQAQRTSITHCSFKKGDSAVYADPSYSDKHWQYFELPLMWQNLDYTFFSGYYWQRLRVMIPSSWKKGAYRSDSLRIFLAGAKEKEDVFLNGAKIGGRDFGGTEWNYLLSMNDSSIRWDAENVIAIRGWVNPKSAFGGIYSGNCSIGPLGLAEDMLVDMRKESFRWGNIAGKNEPFRFNGKQVSRKTTLRNKSNHPISGSLTLSIKPYGGSKTISSKVANISLSPGEEKQFDFTFASRENTLYHIEFRENKSKAILAYHLPVPSLLTPKPSSIPKINGAKVIGCRPGSPVLYRIPVTGNQPMEITVENLPEGLVFDPKTRIISGRLGSTGNYAIQVNAKNRYGTNAAVLTFISEEKLKLRTPLMGWNSWNAYAVNVTQQKVLAAVNALEKSGLIEYGWNYITTDEGWSSHRDSVARKLVPKKVFPDMKKMTDAIHSKGLKAGIHSSPSPRTCDGWPGSYGYDEEDAASFANWGFDLLKHDYCYYSDVMAPEDMTVDDHKKVFRKMGEALAKQPRDVVYNLCQYGQAEVWKWGNEVGGSYWRASGDIIDTWESLFAIGFGMSKNSAPFSKPGTFNDLDMLVLGTLGWMNEPHWTRLNAEEQYTHFSLWCLLASPLLLGCDLEKMGDLTKNIVMNEEVIAVDQDSLGIAASLLYDEDGWKIYVKHMSDGSKAVGIFNISERQKEINIDMDKLGLSGYKQMRDLWRQKSVAVSGKSLKTLVNPHGVKLLKFF